MIKHFGDVWRMFDYINFTQLFEQTSRSISSISLFLASLTRFTRFTNFQEFSQFYVKETKNNNNKIQIQSSLIHPNHRIAIIVFGEILALDWMFRKRIRVEGPIRKRLRGLSKARNVGRIDQTRSGEANNRMHRCRPTPSFPSPRTNVQKRLRKQLTLFPSARPKGIGRHAIFHRYV